MMLKNSTSISSLGISILLFTCVAVQGLVAQPTPYWDAQFGGPGVSGGVSEVISVDGQLIVGGVFFSAGGSMARNIVVFDRTSSTWIPLGEGVNGQVSAIAVDDSGRIYAGGKFSQAGAVIASNVAMWDGSRWHALAEGLDGHVWDLAVHGKTVYAGGSFDGSGETELNGVASWNGSEWVDLKGGLETDRFETNVYAMDLDGEGRLYVGGRFSRAGGLDATSFAMWDGAEWSEPANGLSSTENFGVAVYSIRATSDGVYVGGDFTHADSLEVPNLALLESDRWSNPGKDLINSHISSIDVSPDGDLFVLGGSREAGYLFGHFRDSSWTSVPPPGPGRGPGALEVLPSGDVIVGHGLLLFPEGGNPSQSLYEWNTDRREWSVLDRQQKGLDGPVYALLPDSAAGFFAAGVFTFAGQTPANSIAYWNGADWEALGEGIAGEVRALVRGRNGYLYAAGNFYRSGDVSVRNIARWDGSAWHPLGDGISLPGSSHLEEVRTLTIHDQKLVVGGTFTHAGSIESPHLAVWDIESEAWLEPPGTPDATVLASYTKGDTLVIAGHFGRISSTGGYNHIAMWVDGEWHPLGKGSSWPVSALLAVDGVLHAAGDFDGSDLAAWDGSSWRSLGVDVGGGSIGAISADADGRLFIGGDFEYMGTADRPTISANSMAFHQNGEWKPIPNGGIDRGAVHTLAHQGDDLIVGGEFTLVGSRPELPGIVELPSSNLAILRQATHLSRENGFEGPSPNASISVFPNPSAGPVTVQYVSSGSGPVTLRIFDTLGKTVYRNRSFAPHPGTHYIEIPANRLASGVYGVQVTVGDVRQQAFFTVSK